LNQLPFDRPFPYFCLVLFFVSVILFHDLPSSTGVSFCDTDTPCGLGLVEMAGYVGLTPVLKLNDEHLLILCFKK
jgi:hypothetical protein